MGTSMTTAVSTLDDFLAALADAPTSLVTLRTGEEATVERVLACANEMATGRPVVEDDIRVVNYRPDIPDSTALSLDELLPHTDGAFLASPPRYILMACERPDPVGGSSTFLPLERILDDAPPSVVDGLAAGRFLFPQTYDGDLTTSFAGPVLDKDDDDSSWRIRWRSDHIYQPQAVEPSPAEAAGSVRWLHEYVLATGCLEERMEAGDLLAIPNGHYLHGRTSLSADSPRVMLRTWVW